MTLRFTLPLPMNMANARVHWAVRHVRRTEYFEACDALQARGAVPPPPSKPFEKATMLATLYVGGAMDQDNSVSRMKWSLDWLKTRGYIADDRAKNLQWLGFPNQRVKRDGNYRVELTLTELKA